MGTGRGAWEHEPYGVVAMDQGYVCAKFWPPGGLVWYRKLNFKCSNLCHSAREKFVPLGEGKRGINDIWCGRCSRLLRQVCEVLEF